MPDRISPVFLASLLCFFIILPLCFAADCPDIKFASCETKEKVRVSGKFEVRPGVKCHNDSEDCVPLKEWCKLRLDGSGFKVFGHCLNDGMENQNIDNCLSVKFSTELDGKKMDYMWVSADTHWEVAEMYCQKEGYNLVSLDTEEELLFLNKTFNKAFASKKSARKWVEKQDFTDNIGQRCWEETKYKNIQFWIGLYYSSDEKAWKYTDGSAYDGSIGKDKFSNLKDLLSEFPKKISKRIAWHPGGFRAFNMQDKMSYVTQDDDIHILCKKTNTSTFKKWSWQSGKKFGSCLTGFDCGEKPRKCAVGGMLYDHDFSIANGVASCMKSKHDEKLEYVPHIKVPAAGGRKFIFAPLMRSMDQVFSVKAGSKGFCKKNNFHFPSIHSQADIDLLISLPSEYRKKKGDEDLSAIAVDVDKKDWSIPLFLRPTDHWDDGSKRTFNVSGITGLDGKTTDGVYLYLYADGTFAKEARNVNRRSYIICQEGVYSKAAKSRSSKAVKIAGFFAVVLTTLSSWF